MNDDVEVVTDWEISSDIGTLTAEMRDGQLRAHVGEASVLASHYSDEFPKMARCIKRTGWPAAYIYVIEVTSQSRGRGIGSAILLAALTACRERGIVNVFLHASPETGYTRQLISFYEEHGFKISSSCDDGNGQLTMKADLRKIQFPR